MPAWNRPVIFVGFVVMVVMVVLVKNVKLVSGVKDLSCNIGPRHISKLAGG